MSEQQQQIPVMSMANVRQALTESINDNVSNGQRGTLHLINGIVLDKLEQLLPNGIPFDTALSIVRAQATIGAVLNFAANRGALIGEFTEKQNTDIQ